MGFLKRVFGPKRKRQPTGLDAEETARSVEEIVQTYARFHESNVPAPGCVADASRLPYVKATIKAALSRALRLETDETMRAALRTVYLDLAHWQDGVGAADQGIDLSKISIDADPDLTARAVVGMTPGHERWSLILQAETELLVAELQGQGLWQ
jgi:hypothetical protein